MSAFSFTPECPVDLPEGQRAIVFGERHLRHLLRSYATYYNAARTHLSVNKDAPSPRTVHAVGRILSTPFLGFIICTCEFEFRQAQAC